MQIHELNSFNGSLDDAFLAIDSSYDTSKITVKELLESVSNGISDLTSKKVNKPVNSGGVPIDGTSGQVLRTNGNGTTTWADVGAPTDAQAAQAIAAWLAAHPEATTTVQDGSLTDAKFSASGLLTHIPVVSTVAELRAAITAGRKTIALLAGATFNVDSRIDLGNDVTLFGCGAEFVRASGFQGRLFNCGTNCKIQDLSIDGNRTAMVSPTWDTVIEIATASNCVIDNVKINNGNEAIVAYGSDVLITNCKITNCGGNGIHFSGGLRTRVENCTVINTNLKSGMGHEDGCIVWSDLCEETTCIGNYVENGKYGFGAIDTEGNSRIIIANNIIKNMRNGAFEGIFQNSVPDKIMFLDNLVINSINVQFNRTDANKPVEKSYIVRGNLLIDTGLFFRNVNQLQISENVIINRNITLSLCNFANVVNNKILGAQNALDIIGSIGCVVSDNTIWVKIKGGRGVQGDSNTFGTLVTNNVIYVIPVLGTSGETYGVIAGPSANVVNNTVYGYEGTGVTVSSGSIFQGNSIYGRNSGFMPIRIWGGTKDVIVANNICIGTNSIVTPSNSVVENNIAGTISPWITLTANYTNVTGDQMSAILKNNTYEFKLTADAGYMLPTSISVSGSALYDYDNVTGEVTLYNPTSDITIIATGDIE